MLLSLIPAFVGLLATIFKGHTLPATAPATAPTTLQTWITDAETIAGDLTSLQPFNSTSNDIANVSALLEDVVAQGEALGLPANVIAGAGAAQQELAKYQSLAHDYVSGQVAVVSSFSFEGVPGHLFALSDGGLATEIPPGVTTLGGALGIT